MIAIKSPYDLEYPSYVLSLDSDRITNCSSYSLVIDDKILKPDALYNFPQRLEGKIILRPQDLLSLGRTTHGDRRRFIIDTKKGIIFSCRKELSFQIEYRLIEEIYPTFVKVQGLTFLIEHFDAYLAQKGTNRVTGLYSKLAVFKNMFYYLETTYNDNGKSQLIYI